MLLLAHIPLLIWLRKLFYPIEGSRATLVIIDSIVIVIPLVLMTTVLSSYLVLSIQLISCCIVLLLYLYKLSGRLVYIPFGVHMLGLLKVGNNLPTKHYNSNFDRTHSGTLPSPDLLSGNEAKIQTAGPAGIASSMRIWSCRRSTLVPSFAAFKGILISSMHNFLNLTSYNN